MNTILFLHGFFASGSCVPANALKEVLTYGLLPSRLGKVQASLTLPSLLRQSADKVRVLTPRKNSGLSSTLWRAGILGKTRKNVLREGNKRR